jgi:hypothetical protein
MPADDRHDADTEKAVLICGILARTDHVLFSPGVRSMRSSQIGRAVLRQESAGSQVRISPHSYHTCAASAAVPRYRV